MTAPDWTVGCAHFAAPPFAPLQPWLSDLPVSDFPDLAQLNALLAQPPAVSAANGMPLCCVPQGEGRLPEAERYEPRCHARGEVQTRDANWHDLFNALVWRAFPRAKAAINVLHCAEIAHGEATVRGRVRDALTLLDESGVLLPYADETLAAHVRDFQWQALFVKRRGDVVRGMGFFLFGHALYEKWLQPYVGLTGKAVLMPVGADFFEQAPAMQRAHLDSQLAAWLGRRGPAFHPRDLQPLPLLGVPGWWPANEAPDFYGDSTYFRPGRRQKIA